MHWIRFEWSSVQNRPSKSYGKTHRATAPRRPEGGRVDHLVSLVGGHWFPEREDHPDTRSSTDCHICRSVGVVLVVNVGIYGGCSFPGKRLGSLGFTTETSPVPSHAQREAGREEWVKLCHVRFHFKQ